MEQVALDQLELASGLLVVAILIAIITTISSSGIYYLIDNTKIGNKYKEFLTILQYSTNPLIQHMFNPLGGCSVCFNGWLSMIIFMLFVGIYIPLYWMIITTILTMLITMGIVHIINDIL